MDEIERTLLRGVWLPVARLADLGTDGTDGADGVAPAAILGTSLVVFRIDGVVTVADAACPHRGAALWMGAVHERSLQCPYHGWQFAPGSGVCTRVPSLPPDSPPARAALRTYPVRTAYGLIWTCLDEPLLAFPELPAAVDDTWQLAAGAPIDVACGPRLITENFRDPAHFPFVHAQSLGPDVPQVVDPYQVRRHGWQLTWEVTFPDPDEDDPDGVLGPLDYVTTLPSFTCMRLTSQHDGVQRLIAQVAVPIAAGGEQVRLFWFIGHEAIGDDADVHLTLEERLAEEAEIFAEDCHVVASIVPAEAPLALDTQAHTRADRFSLAYRRAYRDLLDEVAARRAPLRAGATAPAA